MTHSRPTHCERNRTPPTRTAGKGLTLKNNMIMAVVVGGFAAVPTPHTQLNLIKLRQKKREKEKKKRCRSSDLLKAL